MKPNRSSSAALLALLFVLGGVGLWLTFGLHAAPVPARKPAAYPAWWFQREVIPARDATQASTTYPGDYPPAADYAVLTQGQLKHLATAAFDELQAHLPGGAGPAVTELVKGWYVLDGDAFHLDAQSRRVALASSQTNDFAPVTHGQLKEVAHYFFDRLQAELYYSPGQPYPWDAASAKPPADNAVANLGQAKNLFKFDLTTDTIGDGIPDWWKRARGLPITKPVAQAQTANGKTTSLAAFRNSLDPNDPDAPAASALAANDPLVVIKRIHESLNNPTTLSGGAFIDINPGSTPYIKNGDFEEGAINRSPVGATGSNSMYRMWYVGEGPSPITSGGWKAIGGYLDNTTRADYLQWEVQQQINDYKLPSRYGSRSGQLNQYAELDSHWERFEVKGPPLAQVIHNNDSTNPGTSGWSDKTNGSDHGIQQKVNIPRGNYVLIFDYRGRETATRNNFKITAKGDRDVDVEETLIADKDASEPATDDTSGVQKWKRGMVSFNVDGGAPDPVSGAPTLLPVFLKFDLNLATAEKADSFGVFIDNVILVKVTIDEIKGLYKSDGTYEAGYISKDKLGRIYSNYTHNSTDPNNYTKNRQYIDLKVSITPSDTVFSSGARIVWESEDPDDPSNETTADPPVEDTSISAEARKVLDPNDYTYAGGAYTADGNDNTGSRDSQSEWEQISTTYELSNTNETKIASGVSKVRFNVTDDGGDNFIVKAKLKPNTSTEACKADKTGMMTVWKKIRVEYVKMQTADDLPVASVPEKFTKAFVEFKFDNVTNVDDWKFNVGTANNPQFVMGHDENEATIVENLYCTKASGKFTKEAPGYFFLAAAHWETQPITAQFLFNDVNTVFNQDTVTLNISIPPGSVPATLEIYEGTKIAYFGIDESTLSADRKSFKIKTKSYYNVTPSPAFLNANLTDYGFLLVGNTGVWSTGDSSTSGISPGLAAKSIVFTKATNTAALRTTVHELTHAFQLAHLCGNWDHRATSTRKSCVMNYSDFFVLDDATPRAPIQWTSDREEYLCAPHIMGIRQSNVENFPGW